MITTVTHYANSVSSKDNDLDDNDRFIEDFQHITHMFSL